MPVSASKLPFENDSTMLLFLLSVLIQLLDILKEITICELGVWTSFR